MATSISYLSKKYEGSIEYGTLRVFVEGSDVLNLGTAMDILVAASASHYIEVLSASSAIQYTGAAYATNTTLQLIYDTGVVTAMTEVGTLLSTTAWNFRHFLPTSAPLAGDIQMLVGKKLQLKVSGGNPTSGGEPDLVINISYRMLTI